MFDDRAISETIAFVLTFALIITSVGIVTTAGFGTLTDLRNAERVHNAERGMERLANTFESLNQGRAPERTAQLALNGGQVYVNNSSLSLVVESQRGTTLDTINVSVMSLEHDVGDTRVVYENGAVIRADGGVLRHEPELFCRPSQVSVSVLDIDNETYDIVRGAGESQVDRIGVRDLPTNGSVALENEGRLAITGTKTNSALHYSEPYTSPAQTLIVNVSGTSNPDDWRRYFSRSGWTNTSGDPDTYECTANSIQVHVTSVELKVR